MKSAIGYRESPDGGTRHVHFQGDVLPEGWVLVGGKAIPGPDPEMLIQAEIQGRLQAELADLIIANPGESLPGAVTARRAEIEQEVRNAGTG